MWVGIMLHDRTYLHIFDTGSVTAIRYIDEIIQLYVPLFRCRAGRGFILIDDKACPHHSANH